MISKQIVSIFFTLLLVACGSSSKKQDSVSQGKGNRPASPPIQAEAFVVKTRIMSEDLEVPGSLLPYEETEIRPEISGRLTYLNIKEGMGVSKGSLLAKLFDGDLQAQLQKLQVQLQIAEKTVER